MDGQIKLGLLDADFRAGDIWKQLSTASATRTPEQQNGESVHQWMARYLEHSEAERAREDCARATFLSDLSQIVGKSVEIDSRLSLDVLARFACMRSIKVTQERVIASRPSQYEVVIGHLLNARAVSSASLENCADPEGSRTAIEQRQDRRLARFRILGGALMAKGAVVALTGRRGALATLAREENAAGYARHTPKDVKSELVKAFERELSKTD